MEYWDLIDEIKISSGVSRFLLRSNASATNATAKAIQMLDELIDDRQIAATHKFTRLNGKLITAAFIGPDLHWYLFAGPLYCRVKLSRQMAVCQPFPVRDWIANCSSQLSLVTNKDISVWIIVFVTILAVGTIGVIIVLLFILKEVTKKSSTRSTWEQSINFWDNFINQSNDILFWPQIEWIKWSD